LYGQVDYEGAKKGKEIIDNSQSVDGMALDLSEKHLSELGRSEGVAFSPDGTKAGGENGKISLWGVGGETSNTTSLGHKPQLQERLSGGILTPKAAAPAVADQSAPEVAKSEAKIPALKDSNAPAQTYTYRNDQPASTPPAATGLGFGARGFGGSGGAAGMQGMMGRGMGGPGRAGGGGGQGQNSDTFGFQPPLLQGYGQAVPNPATPPPPGTGLGLGNGLDASKFNLYSQYFRPGEQAAAEKEQTLKLVEEYKNAANKSPAGESAFHSLAKPEAGKVNINSLDDASAVGLPVPIPPKPGSAGQQDPAVQKPGNQAPPPAAMRKIIIRTGEMEFEVESFDSAVATVTLLVNKAPGGFVATVNSEKLPNGKVRGSVVVRMPPEHLDTYVLELRKELGKTGELKGQKIGSQDVTKQYTDLESRLKAARAMEGRLLEIIKTGKGEIKDLLVAEKELGVWRTKIEEYEGEKRYFDNQVGLSTLTITLAEKEIRAPFAVIETERVQMGVEVEDVIKAQQAVLKAVDEAKGRVTKSELKQHAADQLNATINFEVVPDKAGPIRDRIEQLGRRTRLDVDRLQENEGGTGKPGEIKTRRKDTVFLLSLYNIANVAPRETVQLNLACLDTEDVYKKILARVEKSTGRIVTSNLNRQRNDQTTGMLQFEVKTADADAVLLEVRELGEVMRLQTTENPDPQNTTRSKRGFLVQLFALGTVAPRETANIQLVTKDVPAGYRGLQDAVTKAKGRILNSQLNEQDKQNITAQLDFEIRRADEAAITAALAAAGDIYSRTVARAQDSDTVIDSKVRYTLVVINQARIPARETATLGIEVADVDKTAVDFTAQAAAVKGRTVESNIARERTGRVTGKLIYDVPLASLPEMVNKFAAAGTVRVQQFSRNQQVPDSELAIARLDVTLSNVPLIVPSDEGFGTELRKGLGTSMRVLSVSLSWLVFGLLVIFPWVVVVYAIYRVVMRMRRKPGTAVGV
jgi:hypothetical protein